MNSAAKEEDREVLSESSGRVTRLEIGIDVESDCPEEVIPIM